MMMSRRFQLSPVAQRTVRQFSVLVIVGIAMLALIQAAQAQRAPPPGHWSSRQAIQYLKSDNDELRRQAEAQVLAAPGRFLPPVFADLAAALVRDQRPDDGLRWWYFGAGGNRRSCHGCVAGPEWPTSGRPSSNRLHSMLTASQPSNSR